MAPEPAALSHPATRFHSDPRQAREYVWDRLPPFFWCFPVLKAKPGAVVVDVGINRLPDGKLAGIEHVGVKKGPLGRFTWTGASLKDLLLSVDIGLAVVLLAAASAEDGRASLAAGVTKDLTGRVKAGDLVNAVAEKVGFDDLTPLHPDQRIVMEFDANEICTRVVDMLSGEQLPRIC